MGGGGKRGGKGQGKGKDGDNHGGKNRTPGDWKFLKNHRKMLAHMKKVGEAEVRWAESACEDAEKIFTRTQAGRTWLRLKKPRIGCKTG